MKKVIKTSKKHQIAIFHIFASRIWMLFIPQSIIWIAFRQCCFHSQKKGEKKNQTSTPQMKDYVQVRTMGFLHMGN